MTRPHAVRHRLGCTRPEPEHLTARNGARLIRCPECGKFWWPDTKSTGPRRLEPAPVDSTLAEPVSRYRCREHHDQPVTWRGRGCPDCPTARTSTRRPRRARPAAAGQEDPLWLT